MAPLSIAAGRRSLRVLCIGAHSDDIEIGCAGTVLRWLADFEQVHVYWAVLSAHEARNAEARRSANALLRRAASTRVVLGDFKDAHLTADFARAKAFLGALHRGTADVDVVLTHSLDDRHQDHRLIAEMTWQTWRDHLILEYEIPKYEGDLGRPNLYVPLPKAIAARKVSHLMRHFGSQRSKAWFSESTFQGLMHLRSIECRAASGFAEAFNCRKAVL